MKFAFLSNRPWNAETALRLNAKGLGEFILFSDKNELTTSNLEDLKITKIFVAHWSSMIPSEIYSSFETIIFHMTDLPFGRGGSPLQNLIVRGYKRTKITALRCTAEIDGGPIYLKEDLLLDGSAEDVFIRADLVIESMIKTILLENLKPYDQVGPPVIFQRRKRTESEIPVGLSQEQLYDFIRMLDAPGYPHAYLLLGHTKLVFTRASFVDGVLSASVIIQGN